MVHCNIGSWILHTLLGPCKGPRTIVSIVSPDLTFHTAYRPLWRSNSDIHSLCSPSWGFLFLPLSIAKLPSAQLGHLFPLESIHSALQKLFSLWFPNPDWLSLPSFQSLYLLLGVELQAVSKLAQITKTSATQCSSISLYSTWDLQALSKVLSLKNALRLIPQKYFWIWTWQNDMKGQ